MPTSTAFSLHGFAFLVLDACILSVVFLRPFSRHYDDDSDKGSGYLVVMTPPLKPSYKRCGLFILTSLVVSVVIVRLNSPNLSGAYHNLVTELLLSVIPDPSVVDGYANSLLPVFQVSVLSFGVAFALAFRASLGRRLMILLNVVLFLLVSAVVDAFFGIFVIKTGLPARADAGRESSAAIHDRRHCCVPCRLHELSAAQQDPSSHRRHRSTDLLDDVIVIICVVAAIGIVMAGAVYLDPSSVRVRSSAAAIAFACPPYIFMFITVFLGLVRLVHHRRSIPRRTTTGRGHHPGLQRGAQYRQSSQNH